jgi:hypothetical protein
MRRTEAVEGFVEGVSRPRVSRNFCLQVNCGLDTAVDASTACLYLHLALRPARNRLLDQRIANPPYFASNKYICKRIGRLGRWAGFCKLKRVRDDGFSFRLKAEQV